MKLVAMPVLVLCAMSITAQADELTAADIKAEIVGRHIFLATPMGGEFPLNYHVSGRVDGDGEAVGLGRLAQPKDVGRWWIDGDQLCQKFETWYDGKPMCFVLADVGPAKLSWVRDNGERGTARIGSKIGAQ